MNCSSSLMTLSDHTFLFLNLGISKKANISILSGFASQRYQSVKELISKLPISAQEGSLNDTWLLGESNNGPKAQWEAACLHPCWGPAAIPAHSPAAPAAGGRAGLSFSASQLGQALALNPTPPPPQCACGPFPFLLYRWRWVWVLGRKVGCFANPFMRPYQDCKTLVALGFKLQTGASKQGFFFGGSGPWIRKRCWINYNYYDYYTLNKIFLGVTMTLEILEASLTQISKINTCFRRLCGQTLMALKNSGS